MVLTAFAVLMYGCQYPICALHAAFMHQVHNVNGVSNNIHFFTFKKVIVKHNGHSWLTSVDALSYRPLRPFFAMREFHQPLTPGSASSSKVVPMKELSGRIAIITGGATGIGLALALELAKENMKIVIASTNNERLEAAAESIRQAGGEVLPVVCDVSDRASVENLKRKTMEKYGPVDLLCCNAGVTTAGPFVDHRAEDYDWVYGVVLNGTVYCIQVFYPDMCRRGSGHIVLTGSQAGMVPDWYTEHGPYTSAKAAVMALGTALRPEAAEHGVGVSNLVVAGTVTEITKSERSRPARFGKPLVVERAKREARRIPAKEVAEKTIVGIKENAAFIATHPELKDVTKDYFDRILAAYDR